MKFSILTTCKCSAQWPWTSSRPKGRSRCGREAEGRGKGEGPGGTHLLNDIANLFGVENAALNVTWLARRDSPADERRVAFHRELQVADMPPLLQNVFELVPLFELLLWIRQSSAQPATEAGAG